MRRRRQRHPALENAVFAAALLLAAFIARELWIRRPAVPPEPEKTVMRAAVLEISYPPLPEASPRRRTEEAVTGIAPIKLSRVQSRKRRTEAVPAPR